MTQTSLRYELHHGRVVRVHETRPLNISEMFQAALNRAPDRTALVDGDLRLNYARLAEHVGGYASFLRSLGISPGDRIALLLANRADFLVALLAAARIG